MKFKIFFILLFFTNCKSQNDPELHNLFNKYSIDGSIIITSDKGDITYLYNPDRLKKGFIPASTFKIPNTLIALDGGVLRSDRIFKWDGVKRDYKSWNKDQTLKSAFDNSCVWCYQLLAEKIGLTKYKHHLENLNYGNHDPSPILKSFWLDGNLRITSYQQIDFLKNIYHNKLPYKQANIAILKNIMIQDKNENYVLSAKTGFAQNIGWYVGFVTVKNNVWFFATNLEIHNKDDLKYRKDITIEALKIKNIL